MQYSFIAQEYGPLKIFREREVNMAYTVGIDASTGLADDYTCVQVVANAIPFEQVATFRERWPINEIAAMVDKIGRYYNEALIVCEINYPGNSVQDMLLEFYRYPRNYQSEIKLDEKSDVTSKYGFRTTENSKWLLIHELLLSMQQDEIIIHDSTTLNEMRNFVYKESSRKSGAASGFNDDTVMALMLAHHGAKLYPFRIRREPEKKIKAVSPDAKKCWREFRRKLLTGDTTEPKAVIL